MQATHKIIMISPKGFLANEQTADTNAHQTIDSTPVHQIQARAKLEHSGLVNALNQQGVTPWVIEGKETTPDDVFCNNWVSFHQNLPFVLYPMYAPNRRVERRQDLIDIFTSDYGKPIDYTDFEQQNRFLESTGSMVLDRVNKIAYAAASKRTDADLFNQWCKQLGYQPVLFNWTYQDNSPVYHTNVIMYIGSSIAGICLDGIPLSERDTVIQNLTKSHEVLQLTYDQIHHFAGNALECQNAQGQRFLCMSQTAYQSLTDQQLCKIQNHVDDIITADVATIEKYGGGSVRCMMLEQFA